MSAAHEGMMVTPSVKLVRPLGEGGMGTVWVADHLALRTQVVVKFIAHGLQGSPEAQERFAREAAAAAQVKSPHVVQTFDHGVTAWGIPYIVMELLEGEDLGAYLDKHHRAPPEFVGELVVQLSRALDRAHARGIVHRDIKPNNVFLSDDGRGEIFIKLLDFGIAKGVEVPRIDSGTKTGSMIGSPFYMSPEQILGSKGIDHRSDLWSLGVVVYEALTGAKPFDAETMGGLAIKIHSEPLPLPTSVLPSLPPAVDAWFARACARNPDERFSSAKELAGALVAALGGQAPTSLVSRTSDAGGANSQPSGQPVLAASVTQDVTPPGKTRNRILITALVLVVGSLGSAAVARQVVGGRTERPAPAYGMTQEAPQPSVIPAPPATSVAPLPVDSAATAPVPARSEVRPPAVGVRPPPVHAIPSAKPSAIPPTVPTPNTTPPTPSSRDIF